MSEKFQVIGVESSPYSVKVRAVLRYRRLPYTWLCRMPQFYPPLADVRPLLMPVVRFPDGTYHIDSTPIILALEEQYPDTRSVLPDDPVLDLYGRLIEDMADEWLTKILFFYRFADDADRAFAPLWVMDDTNPDIERPELAEKAELFLERQTGRMPLVGADESNRSVLETSMQRLVDILGQFVALDRFLFGGRPGIADFGLFGQLKTLCTDPTPAAMIREQAPRLEHWVRRADDLSGVEGAWQADPEPNDTVLGLLALVGDTYLPFLAANAAALDDDADTLQVSLPGGPYRQKPFAYQRKCLAALRAAFAELPENCRMRAEPVLKKTGCLDVLTGS
jgi:glutathione S-transferase